MKIFKIIFCLLGIFLLSAVAFAQSKSEAAVYAIRNAKIVTVTGAVIEKGTVLIREGKIADVGVTISIPGNAKIIDGTGLSVYPGLIDASTELGLVEVEAVAATVDTTELGEFNPNVKAITAVNPHSEHIAVARANGITSVVTAPQGGLISGQAAIINLDGWTPAEMKLKAPAAMVVNYPVASFRGGGGFGGGGTFSNENLRQQRDKRVEDLKKKFEEAQTYRQAKEAAAADKNLPARPIDLGLEALIPVLKGEVPVLISANTEKEIKGAVEIADKFKLKLIIRGGADAIKVATTLKEKNIPVILTPTFEVPNNEDDAYDNVYGRASELFKAGVKFAFQTGGNTPSGPGDIRSLPYYAGTSASFGLPKDEALKGVTLYPAQIFGVDQLVGSVEKGKLANLIITDGDPLEFRTRLKYLFINGKPVDLANKHSRLYEKFKARP